MEKPQNSPENPVRGARITALEKATGTSWEDWCAWFESQQASQLEHPKMAELVLQRLTQPEFSHVSNPQWWAQGVTVAYEQHIGRRLPGQRADGSFDGAISKTFPCEAAEIYTRLVALLSGWDELQGRVLRQQRTSETPKRKYWRCALDDGSALEVSVEAKPETKDHQPRSLVTVTRRGLQAPEQVGSHKDFWAQVLGTLLTP